MQITEAPPHLSRKFETDKSVFGTSFPEQWFYQVYADIRELLKTTYIQNFTFMSYAFPSVIGLFEYSRVPNSNARALFI